MADKSDHWDPERVRDWLETNTADGQASITTRMQISALLCQIPFGFAADRTFIKDSPCLRPLLSYMAATEPTLSADAKERIEKERSGRFSLLLQGLAIHSKRNIKNTFDT